MSILSDFPALVNFVLADATPANPAESDDYRPTFDPSYYPDLEEERDAREMFDSSADDEPTDADWDAMAEDAMHLEMACSGRWAF